MKHASAQQIEPGAPIHPSFHTLQPVDLPLRLSVAPCERQSGLHRRFIQQQPGGEPLQVGNLALRYGFSRYLDDAEYSFPGCRTEQNARKT